MKIKFGNKHFDFILDTKDETGGYVKIEIYFIDWTCYFILYRDKWED